MTVSENGTIIRDVCVVMGILTKKLFLQFLFTFDRKRGLGCVCVLFLMVVGDYKKKILACRRVFRKERLSSFRTVLQRKNLKIWVFSKMVVDSSDLILTT